MNKTLFVLLAIFLFVSSKPLILSQSFESKVDSLSKKIDTLEVMLDSLSKKIEAFSKKDTTKRLSFCEDTRGESSILFISKASFSLNLAQSGLKFKVSSIPNDNSFFFGGEVNIFSTQGFISLVSKGNLEPGLKVNFFISHKQIDGRILPYDVFIPFIKFSFNTEKYKLFNKNKTFDSQVFDTIFTGINLMLGLSGITQNVRWGTSLSWGNFNNKDQLKKLNLIDFKMVDTSNSATRIISKNTDALEDSYQEFSSEFLKPNFFIDIYWVLPKWISSKHKLGIYGYQRNSSTKKNGEDYRYNYTGFGIYYNEGGEKYYTPKFGILFETNEYRHFRNIKLNECSLNFIGGLSL